MKTKKISLNLIFILGVFIAVAIIMVMVYADNNSAKFSEAIGDSRVKAYFPGEFVGLYKGDITFLSVEDNIAVLEIKNTTSENWEPKLEICGITAVNGTIPEEDGVFFQANHYVLTNKPDEYQPDSGCSCLDKLKYTIDGKKNDSCIIPPDGKFHRLEIDYNFLSDNDITLNGDLTIDGKVFIITPSLLEQS